MAPGGVHANAIAAYYNPRPPVTAPAIWGPPVRREWPPVEHWQLRQVLDNGNDQWTNWDSALDRAEDDPGELVVFVTDGDPTAIDLNQAGDAFNPPGTTVAFNTFRGDGAAPSVDRAVQRLKRDQDRGLTHPRGRRRCSRDSAGQRRATHADRRAAGK